MGERRQAGNKKCTTSYAINHSTLSLRQTKRPLPLSSALGRSPIDLRPRHYNIKRKHDRRHRRRRAHLPQVVRFLVLLAILLLLARLHEELSVDVREDAT